MTRTWLASLSVLLLGAGTALFQSSCQATECGDGTIEQNGACVPADEVVDDSLCGTGTYLDEGSGTCLPELPPTQCDELTTTPSLNEDGVTICVGTGGGGCDVDLTCPAASPNKVSVCGRIFNVKDDSQIRAPGEPTGARCGSGSEITAGPCEFSIQFYDALDFAGDPANATPLEPETFDVDDCGRFKAVNIPRPSLGFLGIGIDDPGSPGTYRLTGVAFPVASAEVRNRVKGYLVEEATNQAWSSTAGLAAPSFVDRGAFMTVFTVGGTPRPGVRLTEAGAVEAANDYYFDDAVATTRTSIDAALSETQINGAAIKINSGLSEHSGTGGEPSGCTWESALAAAIPTVLFFSPRAAVMGTVECE